MVNAIVGYIRVRTARQGKSGLGLEAQKAALARFAETEGFEVVAEFVELKPARARMPWTGAAACGGPR